MKNFTFLALTASFLAISSCAQATSQTEDLTRAQSQSLRAELNAMPSQAIIDFLVDNPVLIQTAIEAFQIKQVDTVLTDFHDEIYNDPRDASIGPTDAKVTIVEFFDYNCGYCKRSTKWLQNIIDAHPNDVRIIFKELPLLDKRTKTSRDAAKAALAAARQGKYLDMHFALMEARSLSSDQIDKIATSKGIDSKKMRAEMQTSSINQHLLETEKLARKIPQLNGTPFFIIGDQILSGANEQHLQALLNAALEG